MVITIYNNRLFHIRVTCIVTRIINLMLQFVHFLGHTIVNYSLLFLRTMVFIKITYYVFFFTCFHYFASKKLSINYTAALPEFSGKVSMSFL